jgi:Fur family zinc uptake transcriptional regulator
MQSAVLGGAIGLWNDVAFDEAAVAMHLSMKVGVAVDIAFDQKDSLALPKGLDAGRVCYVITIRMNAAHHHRHEAPKLSRNQSQVLSCLRSANEPLSAYAILDRVRKSGIAHPPTVYRALNELMEKGMVHRLQSRQAFIACGHGKCDGKFAFAVCRECGKVVEIALGDKDQAMMLGFAPKEIAADQVTLELAGLCKICRAAARA